MSTVDTDPFDEDFDVPDPAPEPGPLRRGRYHLPNLDGTPKSRGWMRVTTLTKAISDQYALRVWEHLEVLDALVQRPDLLEQYTADKIKAMRALPFGDRSLAVERWLEQAKAVSGGDAGAKFGTQRHAAVEGHHEGLPAGRHDAATRRHLSLYADALERHGLVALPKMQERIVHCPALEVCGRIDNVVADASYGHFIADLKTQRKFWTWLEIAAQFACYANAEAMWDADAGRWVDMPPVSREVGLVLWMPRLTEDGEPRVDIHEVDLAKGWATAQRAYEVIKDRAEAKSVRGKRAWLRPAPPASETEKWAARFAAVDSHEEGSRLVAEARAAGVWGPALMESAKLAAERLTATKN